MRGRTGRVAATLLALVSVAACRAEATEQTLSYVGERPNGPVSDLGDMIPANDEAALDERLREYWDEEETAIVVSTISDLGGRTIEQYAFDTYNSWGIGNAETNKGVLLLFAANDREARIEVGCGLETVITDAVAQQIMDEQMMPKFRMGEYSVGIEAGVNGIVTAIADSEIEPGPVSEICLQAAA